MDGNPRDSLADPRAAALDAARTVFRHGCEAHKAVARSTVHALTAGDFDTWFAWSAVAAARLSLTERAALAFFALRSLPGPSAEAAAGAALAEREEATPLTPLADPLTEARWWARSVASVAERRAYALACAEVMPAEERAQLAEYLAARSRA